jgi:hypothetical protein
MDKVLSQWWSALTGGDDRIRKEVYCAVGVAVVGALGEADARSDEVNNSI